MRKSIKKMLAFSIAAAVTLSSLTVTDLASANKKATTAGDN